LCLGLRVAAKGSTSSSWSLVTLAKSGVPYSVLLDVYESYYDRQRMSQGDESKVLEQLQNFIALLELWVDAARRGTTGREDLMQAVATGRWLPRMERVRASIHSHRNEYSLVQRLDAIDEAIKYL
jgi:hypothetical protein